MASEPLVYIGGRLIPAAQANISIYDFGIVLGATVTDLLRTFHQEPYRLEDHVQRFYNSCKYARIAPPISAEETADITRQLVRHNAAVAGSDAELAVVYFITPGENFVYAGSVAAAGTKLTPTFCVHSFPMPFHLFRSYFETGLHLVTPSIRHVPPECVDPKIKHRSRLHWWLGEQEAHLVDSGRGGPEFESHEDHQHYRDRPDTADDMWCGATPLLLDLQGNLTETSGSNFLLVKSGTVCSPTPRNILLGISRKVVVELCRKLGIPFVERDLQVYDAITADEAFVTTTPYCMAPVTRFNGVTVGNGAVGGPIYNRLLQAWSEETGVDIRGQVLAGNGALSLS